MARVIRLRRPAIVTMADEPFVPDAPGGLDAIDERWAALCARNPAYFDGRVCQVLGVHRNGHGGATIHAADCAYRFHAVQSDDFDLGVRALGVKAIIEDDRGRRLLGRRAGHVAQYPHVWEFAGGGSVEPGEAPQVAVRREVREETGLDPAGEPIPIAVVEDDVVRTWEVVFRMRAEAVHVAPTHEYEEFAWVAAGEMRDALSPLARRLDEMMRGDR